MPLRIAAGLAALLFATPALAQADDPRFCPNRPSLGESGCTTQPGHVQFEMSLLDWQRDTDPDTHQDTILAADFQARIGVSASGELQVAWSPYGHVRTRDRLTGAIDTRSRVGDVQIGYRQNLRNPDGTGFSWAVEPSVTLPVGRRPVGAGTWAAGLVVPMTYDLAEHLNLALTNEADAAADEDGDGRHFQLNEIVGLSYELTDALTTVAELQYTHDDDPSGHRREWLAAGSLAWQPAKQVQLWSLVGAGLNHDAPDIRVLGGYSVLF